MASRTVLVIDTASPIVSLAIACEGRLLADATLELRRTSERLLATVSELLASTGLTLSTLTGVATLQGPGSFTGLRIGLATVLGWHQSLNLRATALPTLPILAVAGASTAGTSGNDIIDGEVVAAVNAMRGDWMVQRFSVGGCSAKTTDAEPLGAVLGARPLDEARLLPFDDFAELGDVPIVGFELPSSENLDLRAPPPLAPTAARLLSTSPEVPSAEGQSTLWQAGRLIQPIYFRPPAVTPAKPRNS